MDDDIFGVDYGTQTERLELLSGLTDLPASHSVGLQTDYPPVVSSSDHIWGSPLIESAHPPPEEIIDPGILDAVGQKITCFIEHANEHGLVFHAACPLDERSVSWSRGTGRGLDGSIRHGSSTMTNTVDLSATNGDSGGGDQSWGAETSPPVCSLRGIMFTNRRSSKMFDEFVAGKQELILEREESRVTIHPKTFERDPSFPTLSSFLEQSPSLLPSSLSSLSPLSSSAANGPSQLRITAARNSTQRACHSLVSQFRRSFANMKIPMSKFEEEHKEKVRCIKERSVSSIDLRRNMLAMWRQVDPETRLDYARTSGLNGWKAMRDDDADEKKDGLDWSRIEFRRETKRYLPPQWWEKALLESFIEEEISLSRGEALEEPSGMVERNEISVSDCIQMASRRWADMSWKERMDAFQLRRFSELVNVAPFSDPRACSMIASLHKRDSDQVACTPGFHFFFVQMLQQIRSAQPNVSADDVERESMARWMSMPLEHKILYEEWSQRACIGIQESVSAMHHRLYSTPHTQLPCQQPLHMPDAKRGADVMYRVDESGEMLMESEIEARKRRKKSHLDRVKTGSEGFAAGGSGEELSPSISLLGPWQHDFSLKSEHPAPMPVPISVPMSVPMSMSMSMPAQGSGDHRSMYASFRTIDFSCGLPSSSLRNMRREPHMPGGKMSPLHLDDSQVEIVRRKRAALGKRTKKRTKRRGESTVEGRGTDKSVMETDDVMERDVKRDAEKGKKKEKGHTRRQSLIQQLVHGIAGPAAPFVLGSFESDVHHYPSHDDRMSDVPKEDEDGRDHSTGRMMQTPSYPSYT